MNLVINHKHTNDCRFDMTRGCALYKAIHQQHPELNVSRVFDGFIITSDNIRFDFQNDVDGYSRESFRLLKTRQISEIALVLRKG